MNTNHIRIKNKFRLAGFTIVEIILGIGMLTMFISANFYYYKAVLDVSQQTTKHIQSGFLLEEGVEAVKLLRDESWSANIAPLLTDGTQYYLSWNGTKWGTTTTPVLVEDIYMRYFVLESVGRNLVTDDIDAGGANDPGTRKVIVTVSWNTKSSVVGSSTVETYITDLFAN